MCVEGRVVKQIGAHGYFAAVRLRFEVGPDCAVLFEIAAGGDYHGKMGWNAAAAFGARLGMEVAKVSGFCHLTQIRGMICDTSPALVAIAAMQAVWIAVNFEPTTELTAQIETCIVEGHRLSLDELRTAIVGVKTK